MGQLYIDDSIHDNGGFIICACVYSEHDLSLDISSILKKSGYDPSKAEFKSSTNYTHEPQMEKVRHELRNLLYNKRCQFGLVIVPRNERQNAGFECLLALNQFIKYNNITEPVDLYFDEGLFPSVNKAIKASKYMDSANLNFYFEQNSITVKGLQLADLVAHTTSIMLKAKMGLTKKNIQIPYASDPNDLIDVSIEFALWASIRYNFFCKKTKKPINDPIIDATLDVEPYGLYISEKCEATLAENARATFSTVYVGCIH
ncbi:MAG TPA: DUF3800 domain-containing protein [Cytophagaceae bacterium]|jgi:hypothetical protein|nr:DUF3800 domain-containing protein [Cytophagaceae bacterium]